MTREMKDSGVKWIGEVPKQWKIMRFKNACNLFTGNSIKDSDKDKYVDETDAIPYLSSKDINVNYNTANYQNGLYIKQQDLTFKRARKGNVLMCIEGGSAGRKKTFLYEDVAFVNKLCCFDSKKDINDKYLYYFLCSPCYEDEFKRNISGLIGGVSVSVLSNFKITIPPLPEQHRIADFLDTKCSQIDSLISDISKQISILEEYKKSVITEAVTKGLDKNVKMKDSGIEWIQKMPVHWKVMKNKYIMKKIKDICPVYNGEDILSLTVNGVVIRNLEAGGKMPTSFDGYQKVYPNNLLMCLFDYDVTPRCIGLIKNEGLTSPAYSQFIMGNNNIAEYYYYYYLMLDFTKELLHLSKNLRHSFTEEQLGMINVPVPPIYEQQKIAKYLDSKCSKIDNIISQKQQQLSILEEYKKSLIYEYVTGKKEVKK